MSANTAGALFMLLGMAAFALNDTLGKWMVADYGVGQVVMLRSLAALALLVPFVLRPATRGAVRHAPRPGMQLLRVICTTTEVFCFYAAVVHMPLADVMALWMAAPIIVVAVSPLLLGERVAPRTWAAVAVGFVGVVILLGPSLKLSVAGVAVALVGTVAFAAMMLLGRRLRDTPDSALVLFQTLGALAGSLLLAPSDWRPIRSGTDLALLCLLGIIAMGAHVLVTRSLKHADASVVAPLQYTLLVWAIIFGVSVFGDVPTPAMLLGAALIVGSGLFLLRRRPPTGSLAPEV